MTTAFKWNLSLSSTTVIWWAINEVRPFINSFSAPSAFGFGSVSTADMLYRMRIGAFSARRGQWLTLLWVRRGGQFDPAFANKGSL